MHLINTPRKVLGNLKNFGKAYLLLILLASCNKFVDVGTPPDKIVTQDLFKDDASATSAVLGMYTLMSSSGLSITYGALTAYGGVASDEMKYGGNTADILEFNTNSISSTNYTNQTSLWSKAYQLIYQANACIEGLNTSQTLSTAVKNQLLGECKVARSLMYFYLIQLYGNSPLITKSDYNISSIQGRNQVSDIYELITSDLIEAKNLLSSTYPSDGKARPNRYTAAALLARVYLYNNNWKDAEAEASSVINSQQYSLLQDLNKVFLVGSNEAIWQVLSVQSGVNTWEGSTFLSPNVRAIPNYIITDQLLNSFEAGDPRVISWISSKTINNKIYYFPFKYKIPSKPNATVTEGYTIFRLSEQYLIRAEAKIKQGKIDDGIADVNIIRQRARGNNSAILPDLPKGLEPTTAMTYVLQERKVELFAEWGHRWFDLKRNHLSGSVLKATKPSWKDYDTLFPIPNSEIILNNNLTQNIGYN